MPLAWWIPAVSCWLTLLAVHTPCCLTVQAWVFGGGARFLGVAARDDGRWRSGAIGVHTRHRPLQPWLCRRGFTPCSPPTSTWRLLTSKKWPPSTHCRYLAMQRLVTRSVFYVYRTVHARVGALARAAVCCAVGWMWRVDACRCVWMHAHTPTDAALACTYTYQRCCCHTYQRCPFDEHRLRAISTSCSTAHVYGCPPCIADASHASRTAPAPAPAPCPLSLLAW